MRTIARRATRDQLTTKHSDSLPDGIGGTITGGPMERIDLMEILNRHASRAGAVSGAAAGNPGSPLAARSHGDPGIALSDGSRIMFASVDGDSVFWNASVRVLSDA